MKKIFISLLVVLFLGIPLISHADNLSFTTGGVSGTYYSYGNVLAQYITANSDVNVTAVPGNGSADNIDKLDLNIAQLGFVQNDVAYYAYNGIRIYDGYPVTSFTAIAALYTETVQLITCNPNIKSVADLKGKKVSIGAYGSGVYYNAMDFLAAYNMTIEDINPTYQSFGDSAEAMKDGKIDAAFVVSSTPTPAVTDLASDKSIHLLSLDSEHLQKLQEISPFLVKTVIPAGTYVNQTKDIVTMGVKATILASSQVSEDQAYKIVKTIFEGKNEIASVHNKGNCLDVHYASSCGLPYHPGATKYYAECNISYEPDLVLPANLKVIGDESFRNIKSGTIIKIPPGVTSISPTAFDDDVILLCQENSYAYTFCKELGLTVVTYPK